MLAQRDSIRGLAAVLFGLCLLVGPSAGAEPAAAKKPAAPPPVDINSASRAQLKTLPYIGDAEADRIIAARPYLSKAEVVTKKALPEGVYQAIRHRIVAVQQGKPATQPPGPPR